MPVVHVATGTRQMCRAVEDKAGEVEDEAGVAAEEAEEVEVEHVPLRELSTAQHVIIEDEVNR